MERKIHIFEVDAGQTRSGDRVEFDPVPVLSYINSLSIRDRYLEWGKEDVVFVEPVSLQYPQKLVFSVSRRSDLPLLEQGGRMTPLPIPENSGLGERVHVMFFGMYAAAEFNFYGPRATSLAAYFQLRAPKVGPLIRLHHLFRGDKVAELDRVRSLTRATLKLRDTALNLVESADESLAGALRSDFAVSQADEINITYGMRRRKTRTKALPEFFLDAFKRLAKHQETYDEFDKLEAVGLDMNSGKAVEIDLLEDQLILHRKMVRLDRKSRAVRSESAFAAIEDAFTDAQPKLRIASALMV